MRRLTLKVRGQSTTEGNHNEEVNSQGQESLQQRATIMRRLIRKVSGYSTTKGYPEA